MDYELLDSGLGRKLERFSSITLDRPCSQAVWLPQMGKELWAKADARYTRDENGKWEFAKKPIDPWVLKGTYVDYKLSLTPFGHLGVFPEHHYQWDWMYQTYGEEGLKGCEVLHLFAYSGGGTLAAAQCGARVCHVDASKGMTAWARENATLNALEQAPIRWIVDDVMSFLKKESRRKRKYDAIILDPPSFGRGNKGQVFKIEEQMIPLLELCRELLVPEPKFMLLTCHTPGYTAQTLSNLLYRYTRSFKGTLCSGEMTLNGNESILPVPSGSYARFEGKYD